MGTKYKVLVLLLLCVLSFGCAHKKSPAVDDAAAQYERYKALYGANGDMEGGDWDWGENDPSVSGQVLRRAHNALGTPYVWGGEHPGGFDCSGLVQWAYRGAGVKLPRTAQEQSSVGFKIRDVSKMRAGDIVAFRRRDGGYHTGIYIGSGMFIHAPKRHSRVQVESLDSDWYSTHFIGARRVNMGSGDAAVAEASRIADEENAREEAQAMVEEMWDKGDVVLDADHFVGAEFSCNDGQEIEADKPIEVLLVEPGQYARMTTIGSSLEDMQKVVGGYIQEAPFFRDPVTLVCNEEGKISGLPLNRAIRDDDGKIIDVVAGTFFICGAEGDHFSSIPKELQKKYEEKFKKPEAFLKMGRSIMAIPTEPTSANPKPDRKAPGMEL